MLPPASTSAGYRIVHSFAEDNTDGRQPLAALIDYNGTLYGTTSVGGRYYNGGTVFRVSTTGSETVLHSFQPYTHDGQSPNASLIAVKGVLYGTTVLGGAQFGTVFRIKTSGIEKVLYDFLGHYYGYDDGTNPGSSLIDVKGTLYGTTARGGSYAEGDCYDGCGTVYSISTNGREKVLHSFRLYTDGAFPVGSLIDVKGTLYGTTWAGGSLSDYGSGTVFSIDATGVKGVEKVLYSFPYSGTDGVDPKAGLINVNGTLYGTTALGGAYRNGTAFSITTTGSLTTLHSFGYGSDGGRPAAPLLNVHRTLYGTTASGGAYGKGTIFKMNLNGSNEMVLHSFGYGSDGATPMAGLIDVNGTLYGTTSAGGISQEGTVFAFTLPR